MYKKSAHASIQLTVRTNSAGENNNINRAEAASNYVALQECRPDNDEVIAIDSRSKCSMDKIANHVRDPALPVNDIHHPTLQAITELRNVWYKSPGHGAKYPSTLYHSRH